VATGGCEAATGGCAAAKGEWCLIATIDEEGWNIGVIFFSFTQLLFIYNYIYIYRLFFSSP
jgi:hypothetical protein